jgi:hypothetical protein
VVLKLKSCQICLHKTWAISVSVFHTLPTCYFLFSRLVCFLIYYLCFLFLFSFLSFKAYIYFHWEICFIIHMQSKLLGYCLPEARESSRLPGQDTKPQEAGLLRVQVFAFMFVCLDLGRHRKLEIITYREGCKACIPSHSFQRE